MQVTKTGEIDIITIMERVDSDTAGELEKTLNNILTKGSKKLLCDFASTAYISSAGLRVLLSVSKTLLRSKGRIVLCSLRPNVYEVFKIAGINQIIPILPSKDAAIKLLTGSHGP